jgi:hypothetical protein
MPRSLILTGLLTVAGAATAAQPPRDLPRFAATVDVVERFEVLAPVDFGQPVRVRFPVGELAVTAADATSVRTTLAVGCDRLSPALCEKYRGRLRLAAQERDGVVEVRLTGLPKWKLRKLRLAGRVVVPRWAPLEVRLGIGEADVWAGDEDLTVVMGIGNLTVHAPRDRVGSVRARTRIGDASLAGHVRRAGARRMLIGAAVTWSEGTGPVDIDVGLRIGDASVVLDQ